ncbi:uncharacterized protein LOC109719435 [Ananas comosus]|uniref:Uncharacterized protein LOC109719435 n=1 Tax=Ananas comosus TaxID=4615 RepID=A0A6P5G029_ANACO|nr:uncharacterized protein LOC109719435 [Ananas comosus]
MCPLRVLLIFISATLAGFFVLRGLKSEPELGADDDADSREDPRPLSTKVGSAISACFWTLVDMASGRYLWRAVTSPAVVAGSEKKRS